MVGGLWKASFDAFGDASPVAVGNLHFFRVFAFFPGEGAEKGDNVLGYVILDGTAVAYSINIA